MLACLAKEPADRPESAAAVARALDAIEAGCWNEADASAWWTRYEGPAAPVESSDGMRAATGGVL